MKKFMGKKMELFFLFWLTLIASVLVVAGLVHKGRNSGFLAVGGVIFIVTAFFILISGIETMQNGSFHATKNGNEWDFNAFSVVHTADVIGSEAWVIMFTYFSMGVVILIYALIFSAKKGTEPDDND
jgi:hypothetical protein